MAKDNFKSDEPCLCCGHALENEVCYHHEYTQKAYPELSRTRWNLLSVCLKHHNEIHNGGLIAASEKYSNLKFWLERNDWYVLELGGIKKWVHDFDS